MIKTVAIHDLITDIRYGFTGSAIWGTNGVGFIRITDIDSNGNVDYDRLPSVQISRVEAERYCLVPGDCLFARSGSVGKVHIYRGPTSKSVFASYLIRAKFDQSRIDPAYFGAFSKSKFYWKQIESLQRGGVQQNLNTDAIGRIAIPLPPLPIQKQIAAILEKADEAREKRRHANQLIEQFLQSAFLEMFGDPVTNPKGWEKKPLVELCENVGDLRCGPFGSQVKVQDYQPEGVPVWDIEDVKARFKSQPRYHVSREKAEELSNYHLQYGDIVVTRRATIGISAVYPLSAGNGIMHSALLRIRANPQKADPIFLSHQLSESKDVEEQISQFSSGAIFQSINVSKLKGVRVLIPPLVEQQKFAALVEKIESLRAKQGESEKELEMLFQSLMQRAFNGGS